MPTTMMSPRAWKVTSKGMSEVDRTSAAELCPIQMRSARQLSWFYSWVSHWWGTIPYARKNTANT